MKWPVTLKITIKPLGERHAVTAGVFALTAGLLLMAREDPKLWDIELFKTLLTAVVVTGILNMILSFHYAANKRDDDKAANTGKAFDAIAAAAQGRTEREPGPQDVRVVNAADEAVPVEQGDDRRS